MFILFRVDWSNPCNTVSHFTQKKLSEQKTDTDFRGSILVDPHNHNIGPGHSAIWRKADSHPSSSFGVNFETNEIAFGSTGPPKYGGKDAFPVAKCSRVCETVV
jgi:hypothetical protein